MLNQKGQSLAGGFRFAQTPLQLLAPPECCHEPGVQ
jgi:hypothetical protein